MVTRSRRATMGGLLSALLVTAGSLAATGPATAADPAEVAASTITLDRTQEGLPTAAHVHVASQTGQPIPVDRLIVAVRDADGRNLDLHDREADASIPASGLDLTTETRAFSAGEYTMRVAYQRDGHWHDLPEQSFDIWNVPSKSVVFPRTYTPTDQFATSDWHAGRTAAYPGATNPDDGKLDCIDPSWSAPTADGTFEADRVDSGCGGQGGTRYRTDLVTTWDPEHPESGFQMQPGQTLTARVTVGDTDGSWPGIWTWSDNKTPADHLEAGHGEVDPMEHHGAPDHTRLEFGDPSAAAVNPDAPRSCPARPGMITPGKPFDLRVDVNTDGVTYWIDGAPYCTLAGVPADWRANLIVNLSVDDGNHYDHAGPQVDHLASFRVQDLSVWQ